MKSYRIFSTLLALITLACLTGIQGQYAAPSSVYSASAASSALNPLQFSQFYTMAVVPALSSQISAPQQYAVLGNPPTTLYFGEEMQPVSYSQYKSSHSLAGANSLWIKGATAWTQYAVVPLGATVSLLTISPVGGSGFFTIDGQTSSNNYIFYPNSLLTFYAGKAGRHMISITVDGQASNQVVIDVTNVNYIQPSNYPSSTNYYPWYYPWYYYPESYCRAGYHLENGQCVPDHRRYWGNRSP